MSKVKQWLAIVLTVVMIGTTTFYQFGTSLSADEVEQQEPVATEQKEEPKEEPKEEVKEEPKEEPAAPAAPKEEPEKAPEEDVVTVITEDNSAAPEVASDSQETPEEATAEEKPEEVVPEEQDEMPAQEFRGTAGNGIAVSVSAPSGAFPEGTEMKVTAVSSKKAVQLLDGQAIDVVDAEGVDITFFKDGKEIQPTKDIRVELRNASVEGESFNVYHVEDNGAVEAVGGTATSEGAAFTASEFSIYIVAGSGEQDADEEKTVSVTYNFYDTKDNKIGNTDVQEYAESDTAPGTFPVEYEIEAKDGKSASIITEGDLASDAEGMTLEGTHISGSIAAVEGQTNYEVNIRYASNAVAYSVKAVFEKEAAANDASDEGKYEENAELFAGTTSEGYIGDLTEVEAPEIEGYTAQPVTQIELADNEEDNVVLIKYDRASYQLTYNTAGGSYIKSKKGKYGTEISVWSGKSGSPEKMDLKCTKTEHVHTAMPGGKPSNDQVKNGTVSGCYMATGKKKLIGSNYNNRAWTISCGQSEHKHVGSCYKITPAVPSTMEPTPSRQGYTFSGWYADPGCTVEADASVTLTDNVTVYAKWEPNQASYTVAYWLENANDSGYSYAYSQSKIGMTDEAAAYDKPTISHFKFNHADSVKIAPNGSTVVNVYYSRNSFTINFVDGKNTVASISAKYGADISDQFAAVFDRYADKGYVWKSSVTGKYYSSLETMSWDDANMLGNSTLTLTAASWSGNTYTWTYWLEALDGSVPAGAKTRTEGGKTYYAHNTVSIKGSSLTLTDDEDYYDIEGFTQRDPSVPSFDKNRTANLYYLREAYSVEFNNGEKIVKTESKKYEESLESLAAYEPVRPAGMDKHYEFDGWYENADCLGDAYEFGKMPANNIVLYAKWTPETEHIDMDLGYKANEDAGTNVHQTIDVMFGEVPSLATPVRPGYEFDGWYIYDESAPGYFGEEFDYNAPVTAVGSDNTIHIIAKWEETTHTTYTVNYVTKNGAEVAPSAEIGGMIGQRVKAEAVPAAAEYEGYIVDASSKTIVLDADQTKNVITFTYGSVAEEEYTVEYKLGDKVLRSYTKEAEGSKFRVKADTSVLAEEACAGYRFKDGKTSQWLTIKPGQENTVVFELEPVQYSITYVDEDGSSLAGFGGKTTYCVTDDDYIVPSPVKDGYEFTGWDNSDNVATDGAYVHQPDHSISNTIISSGSHADLKFKANWAKLDVAGYEGIYDGKEHSLTKAEATDGYTISYSTDEGMSWSETAPSVKDVSDSVTVWVKASKANYRDLAVQVVKLTVDPAPVTVATEGKSWVYDGSEHANAEGIAEGIVEGETYGFEVTGKITEVGSSDNSYELTFAADGNDYTAKADNYFIKSESVGKLEVYDSDEEIVVATAGGTYTYDGKEHAAVVQDIELPEGYHVVGTPSSVAAAVDVTSEDGIIATCDNLVIADSNDNVVYKRENGVEAAGNKLNVSYDDGKIIVKPAKLTVHTESGHKLYDGEPLTAAGYSVNGLVNNEMVSITVTGSQTEIGKSDNAYEIVWGTASESNYTVADDLGELIVEEWHGDIVVSVADASYVYDNKAHGTTCTVAGLPSCYTAEAKVSAKAINVADSMEDVTIDENSLVISRDNTDATEAVLGHPGTTVDQSKTGSITITKRPVKVTGVGCKTPVIYDGTQKPHIGYAERNVKYENEGENRGLLGEHAFYSSASYELTGTLVGVHTATPSNFSVKNNGVDYTDNYDVEYIPGTVEIVPPATPDAVVTKTHPAGTYENGEKVTFTIEVTNVYNEARDLTLNEVSGVELAQSEFKSVGAGETVNTTAEYTITDADTVKGCFTNTVTAVFAGDNATYEAKDTVVTEKPSASFTAAKTLINEGSGKIDSTTGKKAFVANDVAEFKITVTNTGNLTIRNVSVAECLSGAVIVERAGYDVLEGEAVIDTLAAGETAEVFATYKLTQSDIDNGGVTNEVEVTGEGPVPAGPSPVVQEPGAAIATDKTAELTVVKTADKTTNLVKGEKVTYTIEVVNTGSVTVTDVDVTDQMTGLDESIARLAPGDLETFTTEYTLTQSDVDAGVKIPNTATAEGRDPQDKLVSAEGTAEVMPEAAKPSITVEKAIKTVNDEPAAVGYKAQAGDKIAYTVKVTNTGNVTVTDIAVNDELTDDNWTVTSLEPQGSKTFTTNEYEVKQSDIDSGEAIRNVAVAEGSNGTRDEASVEVMPADAIPELDASKILTNEGNGKDGTFVAGDVAEFDISVSNAGNVTLKNVEVAEELTGAVITEGTGYEIKDGKAVITELGVGGEPVVVKAKYTVTQEDVDNYGTSNVVKITGEGPADAPAAVTPEAAIPTDETSEVSINKVADRTGEVKVDDTINYKITAINTGALTATDITVVDRLTGDTWHIDTLDPGQQKEYRVRYVVTQADVDRGTAIVNVATATGTAPDGGDITGSGEAIVTPVAQKPAISIEKKVADKPANGKAYAKGETAEYEIVVTNTGNVTLTDADVIDEQTGNEWVVSAIAPGQSKTLTTEYMMTAADVAAGSFKNVASVSAVSPEDEIVSAEDSVSVKVAASKGSSNGGAGGNGGNGGNGGSDKNGGNDQTGANGTSGGGIVHNMIANIQPIFKNNDRPSLENNQLDHTCCIFHFLLMIIAAVVMAAYTRKMKKHQQRIHELRVQLEQEKAKHGIDN